MTVEQVEAILSEIDKNTERLRDLEDQLDKNTELLHDLEDQLDGVVGRLSHVAALLHSMQCSKPL